MKKLFALVLALILVLSSMAAVAEGLEIQQIFPETEVKDDTLQFGTVVEIPDYARILPISFEFIDFFPQYAPDCTADHSGGGSKDAGNVKSYSHAGLNDYYKNVFWMESGENAEFAWLEMELTNMQMLPYTFGEDISVKVIFDEKYEFSGWFRQFNYDYETQRTNTDGREYGETMLAAINPKNEEETPMLYTTLYAFGCSLPTIAVTGEEPMRMEITLGDEVLTYIIRD